MSAPKPAETKAKAAETKAKGPVTYTAPHEVYTGGTLYPPGKPFTTAEPKGKEWKHIGPVEKAAAEAADPLNHDDVVLEYLDIPALKALAAAKGVNLGDAESEDDMIAIIKAAHEQGK